MRRMYSTLTPKSKSKPERGKGRDLNNLNEDDLIDILNEQWSKIALGYSLPEQLRKPTGAEILYI